MTYFLNWLKIQECFVLKPQLPTTCLLPTIWKECTYLLTYFSCFKKNQFFLNVQCSGSPIRTTVGTKISYSLLSPLIYLGKPSVKHTFWCSKINYRTKSTLIQSLFFIIGYQDPIKNRLTVAGWRINEELSMWRKHTSKSPPMLRERNFCGNLERLLLVSSSWLVYFGVEEKVG